MAGSDGQGGRLNELARERVAEMLRVALEPGDEAPIDDATRRLMLHLSIDQPPAPPPAAIQITKPEVPAASTPPPSLLRRVFRRKNRQHGAATAGSSPKGRGSDRG
jgi:hypothetical protein